MNEQDKKIEVTLCLRGENLDPAQATCLLKISPTKSQRKGDERLTSTNRKITAKTGLWAITAGSKSSELSLHIDELSSKIGNGSKVFSSILGLQEAFVDVFIAIDASKEGGGSCEFQLSPENLIALKKIGAEARFTIAIVQS